MKTIKGSLSQRSIKNVMNKLSEFQNSLDDKNIEFQKRLAEIGIKVGRQIAYNSVKFGHLIAFTIETQDGATLLVAKSERQYMQWIGGETTEYSPLLMAEYGSGKYAGSPHALDDGTMVGQGTFPDQKHAENPPWHWKDLQGNWHSSSGIKPKQPVHKAYEEMYKQIENVAREVFG